MGKITILIRLFMLVGALPVQFMASDSNAFILITTLYNETHQERIQEYITCLKNNINNPHIKKIHVLYDTAKDIPNNNIIYDYLVTNNVVITHISGRPTYEFCFNIANSYTQDSKIIIANADIYFNETLSELLDFDLCNMFIALTRWNVQKNGSLYMHRTPKKRQNQYSQDAWIFQTPLKKFKNSNIALGTQHCDGKIAFQARQAHLKVINPCFTIQSCHLHLSEIRSYKLYPFSKKTTMPVPWCHLPKNNKRVS